MFKQLGVIGCGLMGGSFALALRKAGAVERVVGYSPSPATTEQARRLGVIDHAAVSVAAAVDGCDIVLMAVPVSASEAVFNAIALPLAPAALLMDVGSTKVDVVAAAQRALGERMAAFVPSHPVAGKETSGVAHADAALYQGQQVILTPLPSTDVKALQRAVQAWIVVGAHVRQMTPESHDAAFAAVSHWPHLLAFAYLNAVTGQEGGIDFLTLAGPGFRDFTRIAASNPTVWRDILLANREEVLKQSTHFQASLQVMEQALVAGDGPALQAWIDRASRHRSQWQPTRGPAPAAVA